MPTFVVATKVSQGKEDLGNLFMKGLGQQQLLEIGDGCELGVTTLIVMLNFIVAMLRRVLTCGSGPLLCMAVTSLNFLLAIYYVFFLKVQSGD